MKKITKRTISSVLFVCILAALLVPWAIPQVNADSQVVYDFHASYVGQGYTHLYHYGNNTVAEAEDSIMNAFTQGTSNWRMEAHAGYANLSNRYTGIYVPSSSDVYIVMRLKAPATVYIR